MKASPLVHGALLLVAILFGANYVVAKAALREVSPLGLAFVRTAATAVLLGSAGAIRRRRASTPVPRTSTSDLARLFVYSLLGVTINQICFLEGLARSTATNAAVILVTIPVLTLGFALALRRERATLLGMAGIALGLAGALILVVPRGRVDFSSRATLGNLLLLLNGSSYALYLVVTRPILARVDPLTAVSWVFLFASLTLLPFGFTGARALASSGSSAAGWGEIGYVVVGGTALPYLLNLWALARVNSSVVAVYIFLQPIIAGTLGRIFLGDEFGPHTALAAALIVIGVFLAGQRRA
ncbi:MAG: DMT family transporter [Planctomycetes bacterium]|nr:DMT family transporter [Planctomycetota bacterium]MBI3843495.1 DMT family transporter [Planctomycetota bacterium]